MKLFLILLASSLLGSSLLPGASSIRPNDPITDSRTTFYSQQYGAEAYGTDFDSITDSGTSFNVGQYRAGADDTNFNSITDSAATFNVQRNGVEADGNSDYTQALLSAWKKACNSPTPSTINIPKGNFLIGQIQLEGPCKNSPVTLQLTGNLIAPTTFSGSYDGTPRYWLQFSNIDGLTISGSGTLDGRGATWWNLCKGNGQCTQSPSTLELDSTKNVVLRGITSLNSKGFHFFLGSSDNILVEGVTIQAPGDSPNTDGIHLTASNVHIRNVHIATGDDCIGILEGTTNVLIENLVCGPGHGISIGSLGRYSGGVSNVTVNGATFSGTQNGVRIKTFQGGTSFATDVVFENIKMNNVLNPIIINQHYVATSSVPTQNFGSNLDVKINNVVYRQITGTSASQVAISLQCSDTVPCEGIELQDVDLTSGNNQVQTYCRNVKGITVQSVNPPVSC